MYGHGAQLNLLPTQSSPAQSTSPDGMELTTDQALDLRAVGPAISELEALALSGRKK